MFENIGWAELLVVVVAGLFIIGPERLPEAAAWLARTLRKVRDFATGARQQLKDEMGSDFDELRKPLEDLRSLRSMGPRKAITSHLLDGYDPTEDLRQYDVRSEFEDAKLEGKPFARPTSSMLNGSNGSHNGAAETVNGNGHSAEKPVGRPIEPPPSSPPAPSAAHPTPFDPDAT